MTIYSASYLECIYEGSWYTLSTHKTRKGAEIAMEFHKDGCRKEHNELEEHYKQDNLSYSKFGEFERWDVFEYELKE